MAASVSSTEYPPYPMPWYSSAKYIRAAICPFVYLPDPGYGVGVQWSEASSTGSADPGVMQ